MVSTRPDTYYSDCCWGCFDEHRTVTFYSSHISPSYCVSPTSIYVYPTNVQWVLNYLILNGQSFTCSWVTRYVINSLSISTILVVIHFPHSQTCLRRISWQHVAVSTSTWIRLVIDSNYNRFPPSKQMLDVCQVPRGHANRIEYCDRRHSHAPHIRTVWESGCTSSIQMFWYLLIRRSLCVVDSGYWFSSCRSSWQR